MNTLSILVILALAGGSVYFAYWGIQRTLKEDGGKNRRGNRRR